MTTMPCTTGGKPLDILSLTRPALGQAARDALPAGAGAAGGIYRTLFRTGRFEPEAEGLSPANAAAWRSRFAVRPLAVIRTLSEEGAGSPTVKAVFAMEDGLSVECVRIPMSTRDDEPERGTLCVSSQVGCRMGCAFCETGRRGLVRSLSAGEIVAQAFTARFTLGWKFRNVVFMGMGEPLDNLDGVVGALAVLCDASGFSFPASRLSLCTVGHVDALAQLPGLLAARGLPVPNLSVSLNSADDGTRAALMPVDRRWPLPELSAALAAFPRHRGGKLAFNYCLIPGVNDGTQAADGVAAFCRPLEPCMVNVIPYNPGSHPVGRAPTGAETDRFMELLRAAGVTVRRRATRGRSIMAACGQLGGVVPEP